MKEKKNKRKSILGIVLIFLFLCTKINTKFQFQESTINNQNTIFAYTIEGEDGNITNLETIPEDRNYNVTISCDNGATGIWDYEEWGPLIQNLTTTRTKCKIHFSSITPSAIIGEKKIPLVTNGSGLYEVKHQDANITYTTDSNAINNLKQTEYRFAGQNPNNYVSFNNELWRIVGLVNTPEGSRIKLIRNDSIGSYSWNSSSSNVNSGHGVNEWSQAAVMKLLNKGFETETIGGSLYYNRKSGKCIIEASQVNISCNFQESGLTNESKEMIDTITWNLGSNGTITDFNNISTTTFYDLERSNNIGKICNSGEYCNDSVIRTVSWKGEVGLIYPSDYGYATSGNNSESRNICFTTPLYLWNNQASNKCIENNWLYQNKPYWMITPSSRPTTNAGAFFVYEPGIVRGNGSIYSVLNIIPSIYLKDNIKIENGTGEQTTPYTLTKKDI